jgi:5-methylthioadenosine/S-adenosylhomocysteine deaminase
MDKLIFRNATVLTMDATLGTLSGADVLVEGDRIRALGTSLSVDDAVEIDATDCILIPGMVDTHRHLWQTAVRGVFSDWSTLQYFHGIRLHIASMYEPEDTYIATYVGALECLNNGVTTVLGYEHNVNSHEHAIAGASGMVDAGVRGVYGMGFLPAPYAPLSFRGLGDYRTTLEKLRAEFFSSSDSLIQLGTAPAELFVADVADTASQIRLSREFGAQITLHANAVRNSPGEIATLMKGDLLRDDMVLVHCNLTTDDEYRGVLNAGAAICAGVEVEIGMALGEPTIRDQRRLGLSPTLGVDSVGHCGGGLVGQARLAMRTANLADAQSALDAGENPESLAILSHEALEWATINGAKALRLDSQIGSVTPGKQADLVLVRASSPDMAGWYEGDPAAAIITQSSAADIDTVIVAGTLVKRDGRMLIGDWASNRARMDATKRRIADLARQDRGGLIPNPPPALPEGHGW